MQDAGWGRPIPLSQDLVPIVEVHAREPDDDDESMAPLALQLGAWRPPPSQGLGQGRAAELRRHQDEGALNKLRGRYNPLELWQVPDAPERPRKRAKKSPK